ncbi:uncharacterized protein [Typha angustifolia]|uniref:uncharacterized protein n=1 Tax=Typha angustifolia TaxID=59011 RepID=UPI003C2F3640
MTTEVVSFMARIMSGYIEEGEEGEEGKGERRDLVTRDLLGGCTVLDTKHLDLELGVSSSGLEKRRNLMSGKMYLQKHDLNPSPASEAAHLPQHCPISKPTCPSAPAPSYYQSVCTIEKVKSALARVERESQSKQAERSEGSLSPSPSPSPSPSSSSVTCSSTKRRGSQDGVEMGDACDSCGSLMAAACPSCLLYVLIPKENPRCPRCDSHVPTLVLKKKKKKQPRIDLNATRDFF